MMIDRDDTPRSTLRHDSDAMLPATAFLRYAGRVDGGSPGRQAAFLAHLADNGFVDQAAKSVGMSPAGGYSLRRRAQGYAFTQRAQRKRGSAEKPSRPLRENPAPVMTSPCRGGASISPHLDVIAHRVCFAFDHFDAVFDEIADRDKTHGRIAINNRQMANASSGHE
jgi:hypothetical protein